MNAGAKWYATCQRQMLTYMLKGNGERAWRWTRATLRAKDRMMGGDANVTHGKMHRAQGTYTRV